MTLESPVHITGPLQGKITNDQWLYTSFQCPDALNHEQIIDWNVIVKFVYIWEMKHLKLYTCHYCKKFVTSPGALRQSID